ncbi:hypothetical protein C8R44DRAFT_775946 [Mycena epipterygia]|nr:hypothetical protein C8R44DRAFT_775946 [Mycena epipterygia]
MLYSLLHETEILRYIFTHSSFSAHLFSLSKSFAKENTTDNAEKHDGPFFFRQLESIVAWQRGLLVLASSKVVRAAIPIDFNLIVVPSPAVGVTPIMDLVDEIYPSKGDADTRVGLIKAHLTSLGIFSDKSETNIPHHNAQLMGILMAMDDQDVLVEEVAADPRKICTMKERLLQSVSTAKECCSTCQKLAYFLDAASFPPPPCDAVVRAWSPPFGITEDMLKLLRTDLLDQFKRYLESVLREPSSEQSEHSETILDRRHEVFVKAFA